MIQAPFFLYEKTALRRSFTGFVWELFNHFINVFVQSLFYPIADNF